jgi:hypothetical protein
MAASSRPRVREAVVRVRVPAVGADVVPTGAVTVTLRRRQHQQVPLTDGVAVAHVTGLGAGHATATASYSGNAELTAAQTSIAVVVERPVGRSA